jgi:hypothetical protein
MECSIQRGDSRVRLILLFQEQFIKTPFNIKINTHILTDAIYRKHKECNGIKRTVQLHSWEMEFSIQYHVTINSQLNDQNSISYYMISTY